MTGRTESSPWAALREAARSSMEQAYAPYSGYRVGAALEAQDGRRFGGCNVENASYPVTMCAERVALGAAVRAGARRFRRLYICVSGERPASPCGMCRQALAEFGLGLEVRSEGASGETMHWTLGDLLPGAFAFEPSVGRAAEARSGKAERPDATETDGPLGEPRPEKDRR
ncbi:MAG: cytidine deaminase [Gemmatimonadota bacterium]